MKFLYIFLLSIFSISAVIADNGKVAWPREIRHEKGRILIYQPTPESFNEDMLEGRAAVSLKLKDSDDLIFGAIWFKSRVSTDLDKRLVYLENIEITNAKVADYSEEQLQKFKNILEIEIPQWDLPISLDLLLTSLANEESLQGISDKISNKPPEIIFRDHPAVLVMIDGDPQLRKVEKSELMYVVNTPFFLVLDPKTEKYYLKGGSKWFASASANGPFDEIKKPTKAVKKLAEKNVSDNEKEAAKAEELSITPEIVVRTKPAELISTDGAPDYQPINGTDLLYLKNTDSYVFMHISEQKYYLLISGRWYTSSDLSNGQWAFQDPDKLPEDFKNIQPDSDLGFVLASVPGTDEAREALIENQIPQTATVDRKGTTVEIQFDGDPKFEEIEGTDMFYAVNSDKTVLMIEKKYYCVDDAIWFESDKAKGPYIVSTAVPDQVDEIPPESPVYNVKYVYIYESTPEVVYVGYTPGYTCSYVYGGVVVYGTGYYYRPWYGHYYYPRPVTYGFGVNYNPYSGWSFSFGVRFGGPHGWFSVGWGYPRHYGYWGAAGYRHGYHHGYRRGYYAGARAGYRDSRGNSRNIYSNRDRGVRPSDRRARNVAPADRSARQGNRGQQTQPRTRDKNVISDRSGNVYRKDNNNWQQRDNGKWKDAAGSRDKSNPRNNVQKPSQPSNMDRLNRDMNSRNRATQRSNSYNRANQNVQRSRPSGGARSGGGRRR